MASKQTMRILEPYLVGETQANGDIDARCPLHDDKKRSCRINFEKNVWRCFAGCGGGNLSGLLKRMREDGLAMTPSKHIRNRESKSGGKRILPTNPKLVDQWHQALMRSKDRQEMLWGLRGIDMETAKRFSLGWCQARQAFSIPVYLENEDLFNVRMYRPDEESDRKIHWFNKKDPGSVMPLYPLSSLKGTTKIIICEGEMDALMALQHGFPAITGTGGADTWPVRWSEYFKEMDVWIAYDRDGPGEKGAKMVAEHLESFASSIYIVRIPIDKNGADVTDYFRAGKDHHDFNEVLGRAKVYQKRIRDPRNMKPVSVSVMDSFDSQNVGRAQKMDALISGRLKEPYSLPKVVTSKCTMDAGPQCQFCPMLAKKGQHRFEVSPSSQQLLAMMDAPDATKNESLRKLLGAMKCNRLSHEVESHQTIEQLDVRPSWDETSGEFTPRRIMSVGKHGTMPSQVVQITGTTWPDPKGQKNQFLAWNVAEAESAIDEFKVTKDIVSDLRQFRPSGVQTPLQKLGRLARDLEQHVTHIYSRLDMHMLIDLTFMSILAFPFQGKLERRGWLDVLVVGDTRTGKSEVAQRMVEHYGVGQFVNCEAATFAGIIGGVQKVSGDQWSITWGIVPMSDRRLVVLDEASGLSHEQIASMSDVRSRGIIRLQKIQAEQAKARTRLVWLSNPRDESMDRYQYGMEAIQPLIGNREDIARFDLAMALRSEDVKGKDIRQPASHTLPRYMSDDIRKRVMWAWSRTENDVEWDIGVEKDVLTIAEWMSNKYASDPPLVQSANVHIKVARLAVAMASAVFSTDSSGKKIIVKHEHVRDAAKFIDYAYSKDTFGYATMSERHQSMREHAADNMDEAKTYLLENRMLINFLQGSHGSFHQDMMESMLGLPASEASGIVTKLFQWGLVSQNSRSVIIDPMLHEVLREIEKEKL